MFTGIVEEIGSVTAITRSTGACRLNIGGSLVCTDLKLGDSVAVNGVCLTVSGLTAGKDFSADVMPETLNRSSLGGLRMGSRVNLERALPANGRFGGHIVSGHIDGVGSIAAIRRDANAIWYSINAPPAIMHYVVEKGSIAIDGISLTVARVNNNGFSVSLIPHTASQTTLAEKPIGDTVNLENDIIGKYVEKLLPQGAANPSSAGGLTKERLLELGYL